jgi:hypothetical protein
MTTCHPDLAYASIKLSQSNTCPHKIHYHGLKHARQYLYSLRNNSLYFWCTSPCLALPVGPPPGILSNKNDIILDECQQFNPLMAHTYANLDSATCPKTRRSFGGVCICLAGGTIAHKYCFQTTVAGSSTDVEFMAVFDTVRKILYI